MNISPNTLNRSFGSQQVFDLPNNNKKLQQQLFYLLEIDSESLNQNNETFAYMQGNGALLHDTPNGKTRP